MKGNLMNTNVLSHRFLEKVLVLICIALWGLLLRPLFQPAPVQAQAVPASLVSAPSGPVVFQPTEGLPYMVVTNNSISLWYLEVPNVKRKPGETNEQIIHTMHQNSKLIRADSQLLPR